MVRLPKLEPDRDYRRDHDGGEAFLAPSVEASLCLYCGAFYGWAEPHGRIIGGCFPPGACRDGVLAGETR